MKKQAAVRNKTAPSNAVFFLAGMLVYVYLLYSNCLHNEILGFDDNEYFKSPDVTSLTWTSVRNIFSSYYLIMYQPLPVLSFAVNHHLTGFETFPIHLVNLCFHLANTVLVFLLARRLTGNEKAALAVALFFGIHPMNVEAVAWISARSSGMYTFFYLLAILSYLRYLKEGLARKHIFAAGIFFLFSLFSKAQAVTLPVVLLLLDYLMRRRLTSKKVILEKIPFFILSLVFGIVTLLDKSTQSNLDEGLGTTYSAIDTFFIVCHSLAFYLVKFVAPVKLCSIYVYPLKEGGMLPAAYYASAILVALMIAGVYRIRKSRELLFCAGLFMVTIAINLQVIPSRLFQVADRYVYFPYIGLYLFPVFLLRERPGFLEKSRYPVAMLLAGLALYFSFTAHARSKAWKNDETLMTDIIAKNPPSPYIFRAYGTRGLFYMRQGKLREALADFDAALALRPDDAGTLALRGQTHFQLDNMEAARKDFDAVIALEPAKHVIYSYRAQARYRLRDTAGALADCRQGLTLDSTNCDIYNTLAVIAHARRNYHEAIRNLSLALRYRPEMTVAVFNRGLLYKETGRKQEACLDFRNAAQQGNQAAAKLYREYCSAAP